MLKSKLPTDTAGLIKHLLEMERDHRTTLLVDTLCDLRDEMLAVIEQLAELDFDAFEFLDALNNDDDDADDHGSAAVH